MARKSASEDVQTVLRAALEDPARGALMLQLFYLAQEPRYDEALRRLAALSPGQCRELVDWLEQRFPGPEEAAALVH